MSSLGLKSFVLKKSSQIVSSRFLLIDFALQHERVDYITLKLSPTSSCFISSRTFHLHLCRHRDYNNIREIERCGLKTYLGFVIQPTKATSLALSSFSGYDSIND